MLPSIAAAHSSAPGMAGFYQGVLHPFLSPAQLLALLPLGILAGLQDKKAVSASWLAFAVGSALGLLFAGLGGILDAMVMPLLLLALASGVLLSIGKPLPRLFIALLAGSTGLVIGMAVLPDPGLWRDRLITSIGSYAGVNLLLIFLCSATGLLLDRWKMPWIRIALRIAGSWCVAIAFLMLALNIQGSFKKKAAAELLPPPLQSHPVDPA